MKAINTHRAVVVLCDAGCADDAYALCRVVFENSIVLAWLLSGDWIARTDIYCLYMDAVKRRVKEIVDGYYESTNPLVAVTAQGVGPDEKAIAKKVFNDGWSNWARRLKPGSSVEYEQVSLEDMCVELTTGPKSMAYDGLYFDLCAYVHSTIPCLMNLMQELGECYSVRSTARYEKVPTALLVANMSMLLALNASDNRMGFGIESAIEDIWSRMRSVEDEDKDGVMVEQDV